jgi:uncharacterized integral membrane protein
MVALILFVVFGFVFAYFATQNTSLVTIYFGSASLTPIPMYALVLAAVAIGMLFATLFYVVKSLSFQLTSSKLTKELAEAKKENIELTRQNHKLELANAKLLAKAGEDAIDPDSL